VTRALQTIDRSIEVHWCLSAAEAMSELYVSMAARNERPYDLIVSDIMLPGGPTGIDPNTPGAPSTPTGAPGKANYTSKQTVMDYPSSETHTSTKKAGGELLSMTVNVIANNVKVKDPAPIQSILDDYLGAKKGQPGFSAAVQSVAFDTTTQDAEKTAAKAAAGADQMQKIVAMLPIGALLLVGFMVAKAIGRIPGRTLTMALPNGGMMPIGAMPQGASGRNDNALPMNAGDTVANTNLTTVQQLADSEPELAEALTALGIENIDETVDVEAIRQKIDLPLEQIKKMAKQKPQAVAMLMKSWLLEERR